MKLNKRKQKSIEEQRTEATKKQAEYPMNKYFLNAVDEKGRLKYPIAEKITLFIISSADDLQDITRQIMVFLDNIRHAISLRKSYEKQYASGKIKERNKFGDLMTKFELYAQIIGMNINVERDISSIRGLMLGDYKGVGDKKPKSLIVLIDAEGFTGELFNKYLLCVSGILTKLGYELFPKEENIIWPE